MIPRQVKVAYYAISSPLMRLNGLRYRLFPGKRINGAASKVQLGPGQKNYLGGWINVDANLISSRPDIWADLRFKLPFRDGQVDCFYSHHVIEHLPNLDNHFREMFRCLRPGGVIRVGGPHGDNAVQAMLSGRTEWFGDWPTKRRSIGGRFENFIFCRGEHLTILTESFLRELAEDAGFVDVSLVAPKQTRFPQWFGEDVWALEPNPIPDLPTTLLIEAVKP
jgi:predicted SAM-dependent methyltransferase